MSNGIECGSDLAVSSCNFNPFFLIGIFPWNFATFGLNQEMLYVAYTVFSIPFNW